MAQGYDGDKGVSTANQEILPIPSGWSFQRMYYELSFLNSEPCTVRINGSSDLIPLDAEQGIQVNSNDAKVSSIVIVEAGIDFKWFGKY